MVNDAYDSTPCRLAKSRLPEIIKALQKRSLDPATYKLEGVPEGIVAVTPESIEVPQFTHPIVIENNEMLVPRNQKHVIYLDARSFTRLDKDNMRVRVIAQDEYDFQTLRALLTQQVLNHGNASLSGISVFPMTFFSHWLATTIERRFNLDERVKMAIAVICAVYFMTAFRDEAGPLSEKEKVRYIGVINRALKYPPQEIEAIVDAVEPMQSIADLIHNLKTHSNSIRLEQLNTALLYTLIGNSWFGFNARETVAVSLEHLPTLFAIVYAALTHRAYKKSVISQTVEILNRRGEGEYFIKGMQNFRTTLKL